MSNIRKRLAGLREDEASEPPKPAPVSGTNGITLKNQQPHQESSPEKQESQAESPAGAKELLVNEARLVESFLELPPMFSSVSENPSNSKIEYAISRSSEKGEAPEPKAKKSVKMQRSENESVFENPNVTKIATLKPCSSVGICLENCGLIKDNSSAFKTNGGNGETSAMVEEVWEMLKKSYVYFQENEENDVGTLVAMDPSAAFSNYSQFSIRKIVPSCLRLLMKVPPEPEIVKNYLLKTVHHLVGERRIGKFTLGEGVMPASFKVPFDSHCKKEPLVADFGGSAFETIESPDFDSGFWWIILLRSYTRCTGDYALVEHPAVQRVMKLIPKFCLLHSYDTDQCSITERRMVSLLFSNLFQCPGY
ncbi:probable alkaline/neutral invertase F [Fagus crenata]